MAHAVPQQAAARPLLGRTLARGDRLGAWTLLAPVAQGGMGVVWAARGSRGELVALKTLLPGLELDPNLRAMFLDEARVAQRIRHANVCTLLDYGNDGGTFYMVLEWVDGDSLNSVVRASGPLAPADAARVVRDMCEALHAAHELLDERGAPLELVHRDVSPHNVLLTLRGAVKLIDFGIAKTRSRLAQTTRSGVLKGKLRYMAPEQIESAHVDRRADVWALGALLHFLAAGQDVFAEATEADMLRILVMREPLPLPPLPLPEPLQRVVSRAMDYEPEARYPTARAMQRALEDALVDLGAAPAHHGAPAVSAEYAHRALRATVEARRTELGEIALSFAPPAPESPRRRAFAMLGAASLAVVVALLAFAPSRALRASSRPGLDADPSTSSSPSLATPVPPPSVEAVAAAIDSAAPGATGPTSAPSAPPAITPEATASKGKPTHRSSTGKRGAGAKGKGASALGSEFDSHD